MRTLVSLCLLLLPSLAHAEEHPVWDPGLEQAATGSLGRGTPPESVEALRALIGDYLTLSDAQLRARISTTRGGASGDDDRYERAQATYNLALLHHLTGDADAARRSRVLLERYAEVFDGWSYEVCPTFCGVWTNWYHNDFDVSMQLALAFDLLAPAGALGGAEETIRELLVRIVQRDLEYRLYTFNWAFYRPLGLMIFGRVLDDPELTHLGYWFYEKHLHEYYSHDGFPSEGAYSYHEQQTPRFTEARQAYYFDGYSDPPGYTHEPFDRRWDPPRIDDFDVAARWGRITERMMWTLRHTTFPDGEFPVLNDTRHYGRAFGEPPEASVLLGGVGHAILAGGAGEAQTQARLDFSHTVGHRHRDALHLIYYGDGVETVGGTAYRNPDQAWNTSTLSHNLVAIDGEEQEGSYFVDWTMSPYVPGVGRSELVRQRWNPDSNNVHNDVLLWEPSFGGFDDVQVTEVDGLDAYRDQADRYRRMLVLVRVEGDDYYLADFFRVRGGTQYDWLLHGGHDANTLSLPLSTSSASGSLGRIQLRSSATTGDAWEASFVHGGTTGRVMMAGAPDTTVFTGVAPRYEHGGDQDHLVVRRTAAADEEVVFAATHETFTDSPRVMAVEGLTFSPPGSAVGLRITLADGAVDYIAQSLEDGPDAPLYAADGVELSFSGRFAHVRVGADGGLETMYLVGGSALSFEGESLTAPDGDYSHRGGVTEVERRESGAAEDAFVVDAPLPGDPARWVGKSIHVTTGDGWTWAYRIERVEGDRVITSDEPGFELDADGVDRQYFPIQEYLGLDRVPGPVTFFVPGSALREASGEVRTTRDPAPILPDGGVAGDGGPTTMPGDGGADAGGSDTVTSGCSCRASGGSGRGPWALVALAFLFLLRRRRLSRLTPILIAALAVGCSDPEPAEDAGAEDAGAEDAMAPVDAFVPGEDAGVDDAPVRREADGSFTIRREDGETFSLCGCSDDPVPLSLGPALYAVVGREAQLFFDNITSKDASAYTWTTLGPAEATTDAARWAWTPSAAGEQPLFVVAWDEGDVPVAVAQSSVTVSPADAGAGTAPTILFLGDSTTNAGVYVRELHARFADDPMDGRSVGTRGTAPDLHEGRSGWRIHDYATDSRGPGANPFFNDGGFDFQHYLDTTRIDAPDFFFVHLGINDVFTVSDAALEDRLAEMFDELDAILGDVQRASPETRLAIGLTIVPCATESGFRESYPDNPEYTRERYKPRIVEWARRVIAHYEGTGVALVPLNAGIDSQLGFPNEPDGAGGLRHTNAVHPNTLGYAQMAESIYAWLKSTAP